MFLQIGKDNDHSVRSTATIPLSRQVNIGSHHGRACKRVRWCWFDKYRCCRNHNTRSFDSRGRFHGHRILPGLDRQEDQGIQCLESATALEPSPNRCAAVGIFSTIFRYHTRCEDDPGRYADRVVSIWDCGGSTGNKAPLEPEFPY